jgi:hypothetical protein
MVPKRDQKLLIPFFVSNVGILEYYIKVEWLADAFLLSLAAMIIILAVFYKYRKIVLLHIQEVTSHNWV